MLKTGSTFGSYEVLERLGGGAMAHTFRVRRGKDGIVIALKVPKQKSLRDPTFVLRFLQEANLGTRLRHPTIVRMYEAGEVDGVPFLAMEYLKGMTLKDALTASGRLALKRALEVGLNLSTGLEHAHAGGVIHRDLKPENIMIRAQEGLKIMDFGIAKVAGEVGLTSENIFIGSPAYAAPEMIDSSTIDHRADLYALGIILFEMLQGQVPFRGRSFLEVLIKHSREPLPKLSTLPYSVPRELWQLVEVLTAKDPAKRLPDARSARIAIDLMLKSHARGGLLTRVSPNVSKSD